MRLDVTAGQYLDIFEEIGWQGRPDADQLARAERVIVYKSAKYSIESPLLIGAALAGANIGQLEALRDFGLPLGIAYQLRDDLLGVFGDPATTGKPAGDDLIEGKRTVLVALALDAASPQDAARLDASLGTPLDAAQVTELRRIIDEAGAHQQVERVIGELVDRATAALETPDLDARARAVLLELATAATDRVL
jgi:geranylgeranyl diphosphate synthase type I